MSDAYQFHRDAVNAATDALGGLQERLSMATEACDVAMGAVLHCAGSTEMDSGQNAMRFIAGAKDLIEEAFRATEAAVEEMIRYGRGF